MALDLPGMGLELLALFAIFGLFVGVVFGFFGMGGSFLVTPTLLVVGHPIEVAVGSGMAFVFGTSIIATLRHRDLGQVDYRLGGLMVVGAVTGIEAGKEIVLHLQKLGLAEGAISVVYVLLLGAVGLFVTREALGGDSGGMSRDDSGDSAYHARGDDTRDVPDLARRIQSYRLWPMVPLRGGGETSLWVILAVGFATGLLSGVLGVGGGFIRMPALVYLIGVPMPVAVGTDMFEIVFSGGFGTFIWALEGGVDLSVVVPLLGGSALGARIGSAATGIVDEGKIKKYFGAMLLLGSVAVAARQLGDAFGIELLDTVSFVLVVAAALLVGGAVVYSGVKALRTRPGAPATSTTD